MWKRESLVVYPLPDNSCIAQQKQEFAQYITFFNPVTVKGAHIVSELIQRNPDRYFMVVLGWALRNHFSDISLFSKKRLLFHHKLMFLKYIVTLVWLLFPRSGRSLLGE